MLTAGCGEKPEHAHEEPASSAVTKWGARTELFMEHQALVVDRETLFLVHMTDLQEFTAVTEGKLTLEFKNDSGTYAFTAEGVIRPGIFRPAAKIPQAGSYRFTLILSGPASDSYDFGMIEVYRDEHDVPKAEEGHEDEGISFLKEQQWKGGFNVEEVREGELIETFLAQGQVRAPVISATGVEASATGTLVNSTGSFPLLGGAVNKGQVLAEVKSDGAAVPVTAPISGVVSVIHTAAGDRVEKGRKLFDLIDTGSLWVEARVYEPDVPKLHDKISALIEIPETAVTLESRRLVSLGGTLDTVSRTTSAAFEVDNANGALKIGSTVKVHIRSGKSIKGPVVPVSALVDEDGKMVAYVQAEGEAFERRELKLGVREGNRVQVLEGIKAGERLVTEGAYSIRLASLSSQLPAHGHAH